MPEPPLDADVPEPPLDADVPEPPLEADVPEPPLEADVPEPPLEADVPELEDFPDELDVNLFCLQDPSFILITFTLPFSSSRRAS